MKKLLVILMIAIIATIVHGQQCTDTDSGTDYEQKGSVKYGVTTKEDSCVLSKHTEMSVEEGIWLKEYYCENDQRKNEVVDCTREGYQKCEQGTCTGKEAVAAQKEAEIAAQPKCGNDVVDSDLGEECDPPGKICYADGGYGQCDSNCKCPLEIRQGVNNNETVEANETAEAENATVENATAEKETVEPETKPEPLPEIETVEPVEIEPEPEVEEIEVPDQPLPGFVVRFVNWIKSLFS